MFSVWVQPCAGNCSSPGWRECDAVQHGLPGRFVKPTAKALALFLCECSRVQAIAAAQAGVSVMQSNIGCSDEVHTNRKEAVAQC